MEEVDSVCYVLVPLTRVVRDCRFATVPRVSDGNRKVPVGLRVADLTWRRGVASSAFPAVRLNRVTGLDHVRGVVAPFTPQGVQVSTL